jgi:threonyl-tRNA synthetase
MAMKESGLPYKEVEGEAAFYGPKIDFQIFNVMGNEFSISTNQLDFYASERFGLTYRGEDGGNHPVYVIHRAPLGSHERFVAFLTEHYNATFPTWLAPQQVRIITVNHKFDGYAKMVQEFLFNSSVKTATGGIRVSFDKSNDTLSKKIRIGQRDRIPYVLVIGDKEQKDGSITVRLRNGESLPMMKVDEFLRRITYEVENRLDLSTQRVIAYEIQKPLGFEDFLQEKEYH